VGDMTFEKVPNFKYLGVDVNESANSHEEINHRIIAGNKCYFSLVPLFKSKLLSRRTKIRIYKALVKSIVLYTCGVWASTKIDEKKMTFERKILWRIFGPKNNTENNEYERRTNAELKSLFNETDIVGVLKSRRLSWARHNIW